MPPYSIRIGDRWYSYARIEPLSTTLALMADGLQALHAAQNGQQGEKIIKHLIGSSWRMVSDKSFLDSIGEITRIVSDPEREVMKFGTNFVSSWMPNAVRQAVQAYDDNVRDEKSRSRGLQWWEDQFRITTDRMGVTSGAPKIDYFGREISKVM